MRSLLAWQRRRMGAGCGAQGAGPPEAQLDCRSGAQRKGAAAARMMSGMPLQRMHSAKAIGFVAINYCAPTPRGVNLCNAAFPPFIGSGIRPGRAPSDRGFFFSDRLWTARGEQQPVPLGMRQGLAHRLVFEQDRKLFRPVVVEDVSTHLEKVHRLAWPW